MSLLGAGCSVSSKVIPSRAGGDSLSDTAATGAAGLGGEQWREMMWVAGSWAAPLCDANPGIAHTSAASRGAGGRHWTKVWLQWGG